MRRVYISTGAFITRKNGRNFYLIRQIAPRLECDGFELLMYDSWEACTEELERELNDTGLSFPVMHADKRVGEFISRGGAGDAALARETFRRNLATARNIGAKLVVLHLWGGAPSDGRFDNMLAAYPCFKRMARDYGLELTVENVVCGFGSPLERLKQLADAQPDALFTYDTKMTQVHLENERLITPEGEWLFSEGRVRHLHVNDYKGAYKDFTNLRVLPIGAGDVDFDMFFGVVAKHAYAGDATIESTSVYEDGSVNIDQLNACVREVRRRLIR